ncbi:hypothetical protein ART_3216 [Arthrobacter sp. PAMC 25486]|nr:hypothetical protein ART_3216 [Arthrobacter sp. PAMC 25486]
MGAMLLGAAELIGASEVIGASVVGLVVVPPLQEVMPSAVMAKRPSPRLRLLRFPNFIVVFMMILRSVKAEGFRFASQGRCRKFCGPFGLSGSTSERFSLRIGKDRKKFCDRSFLVSQDSDSVAGLEDQLRLSLADHPVDRDVFEHEIAQGLGALHCDVQVKVVLAGHMECVNDAGDLGECGVEGVNMFGVVAAEADLDDGLDGEAQAGQVQCDAVAEDDSGIAHEAQAVRAGGLGQAQPRRDGLVGQAAVRGQGPEDVQIGVVQARRYGCGPLFFLRGDARLNACWW